MSKVGGLGEVMDADDEIEDLVEEVRTDVERKSGKKFAKFAAASYRAQVVAGTVFFIKVDVSKGEYVHVRVFRPLPNEGNPELQGFKLGKQKGDTIEYFE